MGAEPLAILFDDEPYWQDLGRLFAIFSLLQRRRYSDVKSLSDGLSCAVYDVFIADQMLNRGA
jgi:hypothetical protein